MVILNKDNFEEEVIKSNIPVIIDFWATWCMPCKMLSPIIDEVAKENEGKIKVCKVNVDEEMELADAFKIDSIPTVVSFVGGKAHKKIVGLCGKGDIVNLTR